jgi:ATP-binding cassette subfamily B protein
MKAFDPHTAVSKNRLLGLWRLMTGYRLGYVAAALSIGIATASQTGTSLLVRQFIDVALPAKTLLAIVAVAAGFVGLAAFQGTFSFISGTLAARTSEGTIRRLRDAFYDHLQKLPFSYHDKTPTGDLIERATSDMDAVRKFYADQAIGFGRIVLQFSISFVAIFSLSPRLAVVSVLAMPFVLAVSVVFFRAISKRYSKYQEQEAILSTTLQENLTGVRVVKAFARQRFEMDRFETVNREKFRRGRRLVTMNAFFWPMTDIICALQMIGGFMFGAVLAIRGDITVGTYMAFIGLVVQIIWPIRFLGRLIVDISGSFVSYERVMSILKTVQEPLLPGVTLDGKRLRGEISFRDVSFGYDPAKPILTGVTFDCAPGQTIALLGSTGSGKTSLVNLIPRFYDYTSGSILLDGRELSEYSRRALRAQVGIVEQQPLLFSRSIRDNITYGVDRELVADGDGRGVDRELVADGDGRGVDRELLVPGAAPAVDQHRVEEAARSAALHDVILSFPNGYDTMVGEKGVTLSGGQKQRMAIARTILKDPRILILDDSTSSVDTETEGEIRAALERLMVGRTTFIIAHRIQSLMRADMILVFEGGRIVERGTHETLRWAGGIYSRIFELQTRIETELEEEISRA